jgi:hypothetical protein
MRRAAIASIASTAAVLALAGCSDPVSPGGPKLSVGLYLQQPTAPSSVFRADIGGQLVELRAAGFAESRKEVRGSRYGDVPIRATLLTAAGDTLASVAFDQRFELDHAHWVVARVGQRRPIGHCIGTLTVAPLRGASSDTLFVTYGRIPDGAIC